MLSENDVARLAGRIANHFAPLAIGVFGSYAVGTAHCNSDLDLFVIRKEGESPNASRHAVRRLLFDVLHPLDIHVFSPVEFEEAAQETYSFVWAIIRQARLCYSTQEARRLVPSLFT